MSICSTTPNDSQYAIQWAIPTIQLPEAWDITRGSSSVVVGVSDTSISGTHPDLKNRIVTNLCRDFTSGSEVAATPIDPNGHGTAVAGIIGAQGNNTEGCCGVCWNVGLASLRVFDGNASGYSSYVAAAINFAEQQGIQLLNFCGSWSKRHANYDEFYDYALSSVIRSYSGLFICSAGNDESNNDAVPVYPANYRLPNLISVGASNVSDEYLDLENSQGSNFGQMFVDLFAPGEIIQTTSFNNTTNKNTYGYLNGTSAAAPFVTGVAALLLSKYPYLTPCEIKDTILSNVDDCSESFDTICVSGGRLNAYKALTNVKRHTCIYMNNGANGHLIRCTDCSYIITNPAPHTYTYSYGTSLTSHTADCSKCSYSCSESHEWESLGTKYRCLKCQMSATSIPVSPTQLPPSLLASIQQNMEMNVYTAAVDDNTVLCYIDEQYYLVKGYTENEAVQAVMEQIHEAA